MRKDLEKLAHLTAGAGVSPVLRWSSPERWREVGGEADGRDPPVSVCVRGEAARGPRGERFRAGLGRARGPSFWAAVAVLLFCFVFFSFYAVFVLYLKLCSKCCAGSKIMEIFV